MAATIPSGPRSAVVFAHKDGKGYDVVLDCLPLDGRISIREPKEKPALPPGA